MTGAINNLAASLAGNPAASKQASKAKASESFDKALRRRRIRDEYESQIEEVEQIDAVRKLADADQEDAREDREAQHSGYHQHAKLRPDGPGRIDLSA
ncbi:MAG: hypothetical protein CMJ35_09690 [Phycisphaerae bacterium]|nr:hypothetical protein [Phycisphaerae bacterium]MBM91866.1 hypothetical protein [Phycisphaerae bacterium]HCT44169.1 hypothetical protein [Phycisphaerales bacterium]|tara:strand:- start:727 stop:1020 length:294 start_codon:yes stop_codon:yes gene_type:complete